MTETHSAVAGLLRNPDAPGFVLADALAEAGLPNDRLWVVLGERYYHNEGPETWTVAAFLREADAARYVDRIREWRVSRRVDALSYDEARWLTCPLDPDAHWGDAWRVKHDYVSVPLGLDGDFAPGRPAPAIEQREV